METNHLTKTQMKSQFKKLITLGLAAAVILNVSREVLIDSLEARSADVKTLVELTRKDATIAAFIEDFDISLDDMEKILDLSVWTNFRHELFDLIADNFAKSASGIASKNHNFSVKTEDLIEQFNIEMPLKDQAEVLFQEFAETFIVQMKRSLVEPDLAAVAADLSKTLLSSSPDLEEAYAESIYYIAGYLLSAIRKQGKAGKWDRREVFEAFVEHNSIHGRLAMSRARRDGLPTGKVDRISCGSLIYASKHFFETVACMECMYVALLTPENVVGLGSQVMAKVHALVCKDDTVCQHLKRGLGQKPEADQKMVAGCLLRTFCRLRGKDFVARMLSRTGKSKHVATRTDLLVKSNNSFYAAKVKYNSKLKNAELKAAADSKKARAAEVSAKSHMEPQNTTLKSTDNSVTDSESTEEKEDEYKLQSWLHGDTCVDDGERLLEDDDFDNDSLDDYSDDASEQSTGETASIEA